MSRLLTGLSARNLETTRAVLLRMKLSVITAVSAGSRKATKVNQDVLMNRPYGTIDSYAVIQNGGPKDYQKSPRSHGSINQMEMKQRTFPVKASKPTIFIKMVLTVLNMEYSVNI